MGCVLAHLVSAGQFLADVEKSASVGAREPQALKFTIEESV